MLPILSRIYAVDATLSPALSLPEKGEGEDLGSRCTPTLL
jgi:hypothetical protein